MVVFCTVGFVAGRIELGGGSRIIFTNSKAAGTQEVDWQEAFRDHRQGAGTGSRDVAVTRSNAATDGEERQTARMAQGPGPDGQEDNRRMRQGIPPGRRRW